MPNTLAHIGVQGVATRALLRDADFKLNRSTAVSIRGTFVAQDRIQVKEYHVHAHLMRNIGSYLGLGLVTLLWIDAVRRKKA